MAAAHIIYALQFISCILVPWCGHAVGYYDEAASMTGGRILTLFLIFVAAANEIPTRPLPVVREQVTNLCINALSSYRKFCATVSSSGQLILPEALKLLPLYTLGMCLCEVMFGSVLGN